MTDTTVTALDLAGAHIGSTVSFAVAAEGVVPLLVGPAFLVGLHVMDNLDDVSVWLTGEMGSDVRVRYAVPPQGEVTIHALP
jgi:hypothetical protein